MTIAAHGPTKADVTVDTTNVVPATAELALEVL